MGHWDYFLQRASNNPPNANKPQSGTEPPPPPGLLPVVAVELAAFDDAGVLLVTALLVAFELATELETATELALELLTGSSAGGVPA